MAMKAYESYKNVDLPWLKRVPEHWEIATVNTLFSNNEEKNEQCTVTNAYQFKFGKIVKKPNFELTNDLIETYKNYAVIRPNDIMINGLNLNYDFVTQRVGIVQEPGIITSSYISIRPYISTNAKFYTYLFKAWDAQKVFNGMGTGIRRTLSWKELKQITIPVPPKEEQDQIVRYLDWQNSRLNKLINAKKREIALLEEQKQALISQAVTKGLDPHAPLKDSGIDWIGQIPEHWLLCNLKYLCSMKSGKNLTSIQITENGPYPVYGGNGVRGYYSQYNVSGKCLIIGRVGALCGNVHHFDGEFWVTDNAFIVEVFNYICVKYLYYLLTAMKLNKYVPKTAAQPVLSTSNLLFKKACVPPLGEQRKIANYLDNQCIFIDNLINNINKTISLLQEYRTRLVADVVTGQIDVRHIAIPNYETITETIDQPEADEDSTICTEDQ